MATVPEKSYPGSNKRDIAVDNLKGILIILVILGHGGLLTSFRSPFFNFIQEYIYLFHMPLFFGLSVLFVKELSWRYIGRRFVKLMIPFYFFVIIDPVHLALQIIHPGLSAVPLLYHLNLLNIVKTAFISSGFYLQSPLWFLPALFVTDVVFSFLFTCRFNTIILVAFSVLFCVVLFFAERIQTAHSHIPYGVDVAIYIMPLLFLLRYVYENKSYVLKYNPVVYIAGIVLFSLLILYLLPEKMLGGQNRRFDLAEFFVPGTILGYTLICALSVCIFLFFLYFNKPTIFSKIGLYTLPIFIFHTYPWFDGLQHFQPALFLFISVIGNLIIGVGLSKLLMRLSTKFSSIGMVA